MAILNVVLEGDPILREKCREVTEITERTKILLDDMIETLHQQNGCGLAAPQVGIKRRICIVEVNEGELFELINPVIIKESGNQEELEGCLSLPHKWGITKRPMSVTVQAQNRNGDVYTVSGEGLMARALCHEIDHLDGILYTDKVIEMVDESELEAD